MKRAIFTVLVLVMLCAGLGCSVNLVSLDAGPSIWTDKADYDPGEVVTLYGNNFSPGPVTLTVTRPDGETDQIPDVSADSSGSFAASYPLNGIIGTYIVNATDSIGQTAQTTFTDGATGVSVGDQVGTLAYGTAGSVTYTITVWGSGIADVSLSISGLPAGASATFDPNPIQGKTAQWPTKTSILTISTTDWTPPGKYAFTVHAGGHDASGTLTIGAGCTMYYKDADGDNYGLTSDSKYLCAPEDDYTTTVGGDCDDADANEHPGQTWYKDADNDGYSDGTTDTTSCTRPMGYKVASELAAASGDCDDADGNEHPGQTWYKDADNDGYSDGTTDTTSCTRPPDYKVTSELAATSGDCDDNDGNEHPDQTWYKDADDDGYSDGTTDTTSCTRPMGYKVASELISTSGDNDDSDAGVNPGATEVPYNGKDDDCNPATPDDDLDQDGYLLASDCDDNDAAVHPGVTEVCNGIDDDCDGKIDEGLTTTYYQDNDGDTYGNPTVSQKACSQPTGYVSDNTDCDDNDGNEHPGQTWYKDADDDGYSDGTTDTTSCTRPPGYKVTSELAATSGDCDDADGNEHPGQTWYKDADNDGYSDGTTDTTSCTRPMGYKVATELISTSGDNDDSDAGVNPGATEVPYNGKDDDCNPATPDDDIDQDGYLLADDCDDNDAAVHPGATEVCNGIDDDCDELVDEESATGCAAHYRDGDDDSYGVANDSKCLCAPEGDYTAAQGGDCNDADANEHPDQTWYKDADNDGYSDGTTDTTSCTRPPGYKVASELISTSGDNDDSDAGVNPGTTEVPPAATGGGTTTPGGDTTTPGGDTDTPSIPSPRGGRTARTVLGCFIATAAYGTPTAEQIDLLREFRDVVLLNNTIASQFVALYYQLSPPIAEFIAGNELLKTLVRELVVDPIVWVVDITEDLWRN